MPQYTYLSALNPIRFFPLDEMPEDDYVQKYYTGDDTYIQVISDGADYDLFALNKYGKAVDTGNNITKSEETVSGLKFTTFAINFSGMYGCYKMQLVEKRGGIISDTYYSIPVCVSHENKDLMLLQYRNVRNKGDIRYRPDPLAKGIDIFSLRVEGGFEDKCDIPKSADTVYMNGDLRHELLHSIVYHTRQITIGDTSGIPDKYFIHTIQHIFGCDAVFVNNKSYTKYEGAQFSWKEIEHYPLRTWQIELSPTGWTLDRTGITGDALFHQGWMHIFNYLYNDSFLKSFDTLEKEPPAPPINPPKPPTEISLIVTPLSHTFTSGSRGKTSQVEATGGSWYIVGATQNGGTLLILGNSWGFAQKESEKQVSINMYVNTQQEDRIVTFQIRHETGDITRTITIYQSGA